MDSTYKIYQNNPPHLFLPECHYFITGATWHHVHHLQNPHAKARVVDYMFKSFAHYDWIIEDWVLLDNHYHIMARSSHQPDELPQIINNFHKFSALWLKKNIPLKTTPKIWHNYWDTCITYESSYYARLHYIWYNPVKHGYEDDPADWKFGSFYTRDSHETASIMQKYPIDRVKINDDY